MKNLLLFLLIAFFRGIVFAQEPLVPVEKESNKPVIYLELEEEAEFPGGWVALKKFLAENLRYPPVAMESGIEGRCLLQFIVSETGELSDIQVKRGVPNCPECDEEAIRLVKSMPRWNPGKSKGISVKSGYTVTVVFNL